MELSQEQDIALRLDSMEKKIRNSFVLMKKDMDEMQGKLNDMRSYMNEFDARALEFKKRDDRHQDQLKEDMASFSEKTSQLKIALSSIKAIKGELVVVRDLSKIEEKIRHSFKKEIDGYKDEIISLRAALQELNVKLDEVAKRRSYRQKVELQKLPSPPRDAKSSKKSNWSFMSNFDF